MSCGTSMGNCNSKRQENANCEANNHDNSNLMNSEDRIGASQSSGYSSSLDNNVIQEQVTSQRVASNNLGKSNSTQKNSTMSPEKKKKNTMRTPPKPGSGADDGSGNDDKSNKRTARTENDVVIDTTRAQVNSLLDGINQFQGTSSNDKDYRYLDEMLTRCILKLDTIECNDSQDRANRKEAIRGVNDAISILERKLEINTEIKDLEQGLKTDQ